MNENTAATWIRFLRTTENDEAEKDWNKKLIFTAGKKCIEILHSGEREMSGKTIVYNKSSFSENNLKDKQR